MAIKCFVKDTRDDTFWNSSRGEWSGVKQATALSFKEAVKFVEGYCSGHFEKQMEILPVREVSSGPSTIEIIEGPVDIRRAHFIARDTRNGDLVGRAVPRYTNRVMEAYVGEFQDLIRRCEFVGHPMRHVEFLPVRVTPAKATYEIITE